jgi:hypothetical protein
MAIEKVNFISAPLNAETTPPNGEPVAIPLGDNNTDPRDILHYLPWATATLGGAIRLYGGDVYGKGQTVFVGGLHGLQLVKTVPDDFDCLQYDASNEDLDGGLFGVLKYTSIFGDTLAHTGTSETADRTWFGKLNTFNNVSAVGCSLDSLLSKRFAFFVQNLGVGTVTFAPTTGSINVATLATDESGIIFFNGTDWTLLKFGGSGGTSYSGTPNQVVATDPSGSSSSPAAVRALVAADIPSLPESKITNLVTDLAALIPSSYLDTDGTLAANSDTKIATQKAVKTYVGAHGGSSTLAGDSDVSITSVADKNILAYDSASGLWKNRYTLDIDGTLAANSDAKIASQKATKSYVDNQLGGGGGIGLLYPAMTKPVSSNFSWVNQLSTTVTDNSDRMTFSLPTNGSDPNWRLFIQSAALPSPPFTVRAAFCIHIQPSSYFEMTIGVRNSSSGKFVDMNLNMPGGATVGVRKIDFNSVTSVSAVQGLTNFSFSPVMFIKFTDDGTTRKFWISVNGKTYQQCAFTEATGHFITPDQAYIGCANFTGSTLVFDVYDWLVTNSIV